MPRSCVPDRPAEVPLHGGTANRGLVVRVGDTVRRPRRPTSPATEALLGHLADVGFDAPRFLGIDEQGREVLTYIPGQAVTPAYPAWSLTDEALVSVAELLHRYHDAVTTFDPAGRAWPQPVPAAYRGALVGHNDPNLDNVVFRDGRAVALLDFDLAGPGSRLWDVAATARLWAPLRADDDVTDARSGRTLTRLRLLVDAYGLGSADRELLVDAVVANHDWSYDIQNAAVDDGHAAFTEYLAGGVADRAARTRRWYVRHGARLRDAVR